MDLPLSCRESFPAAELRTYRQELHQRIANGEPYSELLREIAMIDALRIQHQKRTNCMCWHTVAELNAAFAGREIFEIEGAR
jgi:hypothetical protein